jgi:hypothetical protein
MAADAPLCRNATVKDGPASLSLRTDMEYRVDLIGTVRLNAARGDGLCWGLLIPEDGRSIRASMESALLVYAYADDHCGCRAAHVDVRNTDERVWQRRKCCAVIRSAEIRPDYLCRFDREAIASSQLRYRRFLDCGNVGNITK